MRLPLSQVEELQADHGDQLEYMQVSGVSSTKDTPIGPPWRVNFQKYPHRGTSFCRSAAHFFRYFANYFSSEIVISPEDLLTF